MQVLTTQQEQASPALHPARTQGAEQPLVEFHDCLNPVSDEDWDYLFGYSANSAAMIKHLDYCEIPDFKFASLLVKLGKKPILLLPLFGTSYKISALLEAPDNRVLNFCESLLGPLMRIKMLRVGIVDQQFGQIGYDRTLSPEALLNSWRLALSELKKYARRNAFTAIAFTEFTSSSGAILPLELMQDFTLLQSAPFCRLSIDFNSIEEFLQSMDKETRHFLRRSVRKSAPVKRLETREADAWSDDIYRLYMQQVQHSDINLNGTRNKKYFESICKIDPESFFALYLLEEKLVAFELLSTSAGYITSKFIGLDHEIARQYNLYFRSWMDLIDFALKNQFKTIDLGCTHEKLKAQLGAKDLLASGNLIHLANPFLNALLHNFSSKLHYQSEIPTTPVEFGSYWQ